MKTSFWSTLILVWFTTSGKSLLNAAEASGQETVIQPYTAVEAGPHHRVWRSVTADGAGRTSEHSYVELASGLNYLNPATGQWEASDSTFEVLADGHAVARKGQYQVIISPVVNDVAGTVDYLTPDGKRLRSTILGLNLHDRSSGKGLLIAELTQKVGELVAPNQVLFRSCFDNLDADVSVTYERGRFHQDVILHQGIDAQQVAALGLSVATTRLEIWTEFFEAPAANIKAAVIESESDPILRAAMAEPDVIDELLDFGIMKMPAGSAYLQRPGQDRGTTVKISKRWLQINGRTFLVESLNLSALGPLLAGLPTQKIRERLYATRQPPAPVLTVPGKNAILIPAGGDQETLQASLGANGNRSLKNGLVLDYVTVNASLTNYVFSSDTTYYISGFTTASGTTTFEGGTVLKYAQYAELDVGAVNWKTTSYRPAVFTAKDDDTVAEIISGSSGNPNNSYYAYPALYFDTSGSGALALPQNVRVSHAYIGLNFLTGSGHVVKHGQFVHCQTAIEPDNCIFSLRNVLVSGVDKVLYGYANGSTGRLEHVTVDKANYLNYGPTCTLYITNSLLVAVTNAGSYTADSVSIVTNGSTVFQTVGAGNYYLQSSSPYRDNGTTNINATLRADIGRKTTYPPLLLLNDFTVPTVLEPQAQRDTDVPDRGYHYDNLDYCLNGLSITNTTLTLTNGVAIGIYGTKGFTLNADAKIISEGGAASLNRLTRYQTVQETSTNWGATASTMSLIELGTSTANSEVRFKFTDISLMANLAGKRLFISMPSSSLSVLALTDCQLRGTYFQVDNYFAPGMTVSLTNNILHRTYLYAYQDEDSYAFTLNLFNNLFLDSTVNLLYSLTSTTWTVKDNLFDNVTVAEGGYNCLNSNNGYKSTTALGGGSNNKTLTSTDYQIGPLGNYYYPTNGGSLSQLIDTGSRTADAAGLYHYCTTTNLVKEQVSTVDIGYHYVSHTISGTTPVATVWVEDAVPTGATQAGDADGWNWISSSPSPYSGSVSHQSALLSGTHQHYFYGATQTLAVNSGNSLFCYVYLDPSNPPTEVMLQWYTGGSWEHRAYWGANSIGWGTDGTASRRYMGSLPPSGGWVRLEVAASYVGLEGATLDGMAFSLYGGKATWDYAGKTESFVSDTDGDGFADYLEDRNGNGTYDSGAGETDWQNSNGGAGGASGLVVFTPLK
jgi:hypothetical protein